MPVERHEQDGDQRDMIRKLRARLDECEAERSRRAAAAMSEQAQLLAEVAMLQARLSDLTRMLLAQQEAASQLRAEGWRAGYDQRALEEEPQVPPPGTPGERHLRIVGCAPAAAAAGRALLRHKVALSTLAAGALIVAAVPAWHTAEFRVAVPGRGAGPVATAQAFAPQGRPSSPPGQGKSPHPTPGGSHGHGHSPSPGPQGTPPGHASPSPSPDSAAPDPGTPAATPAPDPDPSGTPAAACTPA